MRAEVVNPQLILYLMVLCLRWKFLVTGEAVDRAPVDARLGDCPLRVTEMDSHRWMLERCYKGDTSHCCEAIIDLVKILLFSWLHSTGSFLLPNNQTAAVCMDSFQQHLKEQGVSENVSKGCSLTPDDFVTSTESCNKIQKLSSFERAVDTAGMRQYCNGSRLGVFDCDDCLRAMSDGLNQLQNDRSGEGKSNCWLFTVMYVGGGINAYEDLGPDAAFCLLRPSELRQKASAPVAQNENRIRTIEVALGVAIPAVAIVLLLTICGWLKCPELYFLVGSRRMKLLQRQTQLVRKTVDVSTGLAFFGLSQIRACTGSFSASNVIGEGGFGTVYRGTLPDGSRIAIKRYKDSTAEADADFIHEVQIISSVNHRNLLPLRGYSIENNEQGLREHILVYDFMENGSLADYLFWSNKPCLSWPQRQKIAVGIARGLAYLHEDAKPAIIHRDIKAANVLLDADLNPLVSDFGSAKFKPEEDRSHYTTQAVGTLGYVAPEYALYGHLTDKSDAFSFGILLLELLSGRKALDSSARSLEHLQISDWACDLVRKGRSQEVIDPRIRDTGLVKSMERLLLLALQCADPKVVVRPSIPQALLVLEGMDDPQPLPVAEIRTETEKSCNDAGEVKSLMPLDGERRIMSEDMSLQSIISSAGSC